ncbi:MULTISPECIES: HDIG domain-containing metalloprotein [unclassified Clostridium]|uniref:HDIG domain-containing metalloprotein n=1 Tax=unclassified Clostridium TaxID=2614128 RepID=UPI00189B4B7D|nr:MULTISPECIES: HDIG domain-containing metalloprotein [unclassified Clostridium]MCR1953140.1 HDIG domain-containing protein [Clostridium sp. DSM 100503]
MALYRVKQFIWGFTSLFKEIDYKYISEFLNEDEIKIFNKLKHNDKHHCIRVCKDSIKMKYDLDIDIDVYKLGKAALLHDVGKSKKHLSLMEKSVVVLLDKATKGKIKKYDNIKQIDIYYNHPKIGLDILKGFDYDKEFLQVIRYHHNKDKIKENEILNIISRCDDKN